MASGDTQVVVNGTEAGSALGPQIPDASEHSGNFASLGSKFLISIFHLLHVVEMVQ
jgi:hypothetical protein